MPGQSEPGSDDIKEILCIPQSSSITGTSPSDCLVSYPGHSLGWGGSLTPLQRSSWHFLQPHPTGQNYFDWFNKKKKKRSKLIKPSFLLDNNKQFRNLSINFMADFCPHLGTFCCFYHYVSATFHLWPSSGYRQQLWKAVITGDTFIRLSIPIRGRS